MPKGAGYIILISTFWHRIAYNVLLNH